MASEGDGPGSAATDRVSTLEGAGTLGIVAGVLMLAGIVASPDMVGTFLPIGGFAIAIGVLVVWLARRSARR